LACDEGILEPEKHTHETGKKSAMATSHSLKKTLDQAVLLYFPFNLSLYLFYSEEKKCECSLI
jgi:hypothetical protein